MLAHPWSLSAEAAAAALECDTEQGLTEAEAQERLLREGPNRLIEEGRRGHVLLFLSQFADLMVGLLAAAAVISAVIGEWMDTLLISLIVLANAAIGFAQELKAERAVEALKKLSRPRARVLRSGLLREIPAEQLVPGDVAAIQAGDVIPADARVISAVNLELDESPLTGESLAVEKVPGEVSEATPLPERSCMVHSGTSVVQGRARVLVTATGMQTELGRIAALLESAESGQTPLQKRLAGMNRWLALGIVLIGIVIFLTGVLREPRDRWTPELASRMLLVAVSLAVAAIPEGLPAVITVTLAIGSQRMAARNAIIRRLSAVEALGSVDVICSDKTGTLTQNRMVVAEMIPAQATPEGVQALLAAAALCNDAQPQPDGTVQGSATESAILLAVLERGQDVQQLRRTYVRQAEIPFSSERKRMSTLHVDPVAGQRLFVKGASERILALCADRRQREEWLERADQLAATGQRVLAFATRVFPTDRRVDLSAAEESLEFLGLIGIIDPVRPEVRDAIQRCRSAGIRPVMITGDHPGTARSVGTTLGMLPPEGGLLTGADLNVISDEDLSARVAEASGFARVSPEHKLRIVRAHQSLGRSVAMTGDGVNDAPALKQADIGVAMGITGTDVSKEAAEMVLADDNFATIVAAVEEGRVVYDNIRKFVGYLLTANTGEVLVLFVTMLLGLPLPLLPVHLLWINLVTDGLPALALGFEPAEKDVMRRLPRKREESLLAGGMLMQIAGIGSLIAGMCVALFWFADAGKGQTLVFFVLAASQLFYVLSVRSRTETLWRLGLTSNSRLTAAVLLGLILQFSVLTVPSLRSVFRTVQLSAAELGGAVLISLIPFAVAEFLKIVRHKKGADGQG